MFVCPENGKPEIWKGKAKIFRKGPGISKFSGKDSPASYKYFQPFHNHDNTPQISFLLLHFLTFLSFSVTLFQLFHSTWPSSSNNLTTWVIDFVIFYVISKLYCSVIEEEEKKGFFFCIYFSMKIVPLWQ